MTLRRWQLSKSQIVCSTRIAVLVSGGGRSLENICEKIEEGNLKNVTVAVVISSKESAGAVSKARRRNIPCHVVNRKRYSSKEEYSDAISSVCDDHKTDLIVMAGWLHLYLIPLRYAGRVLNIHPSLIPAFCGKGFYGDKVHQAVVSFKGDTDALLRSKVDAFAVLTNFSLCFFPLLLRLNLVARLPAAPFILRTIYTTMAQ